MLRRRRMPGAVVTLENPVTGYRNQATTNDRGEFIFNNVPFDSYVLRVQIEGIPGNRPGGSRAI